MGKNRLVERVLAIKEYNQAYRDHLKKLTEKAFAAKEINAAIARLETTVRSADRKQGPKGFGPMGGQAGDLRRFVSKRVESVVAQLDGRSEGKALQMNFGGFGGFGGKGPKQGDPSKKKGQP
jgi:hypothetical protein